MIPVDFSSTDDLEINKAIELADEECSIVNLVHVVKNNSEVNRFSLGKEFQRLLKLKSKLEKSIPNVNVCLHEIQYPSIEEGIVQLAKKLKVELIIMSRKSGKKIFSVHKTLSPSLIAKKTHAAVLTLKPGSDGIQIRSIVLPFRSRIPKRKLEMVVPLAWKKKVTIYLVAMQKELRNLEIGDSSVSHTLVESYRLLKEDLNCQIVNKLITGNNFAKSILRFAQSVNADILMTNPDETKVSNWSGLDIADLLEPHSRLQVLVIEPENVYKMEHSDTYLKISN